MAELVANSSVDAAVLGHNKALSDLGQQITKIPSRIQGAVRDQAFVASRATLSRLTGTISEALGVAAREGLGIRDASARLRKEFTGMRQFELNRVARTELNRAQQTAAFDTIRSHNVTFHEWITGSDERVRSSHRELHGEITRVGAPFSNGLRRPLEPGAPLDQIANCRCRLAPFIMPSGLRAPHQATFRSGDLVRLDPAVDAPIKGVDITESKVLSPGNSGDQVELLTMADNTQLIRKTYRDPSVRRRELASAEFGDRMGAPVARLHEVGDNKLIFEFVEGAPGGVLTYDLPASVTTADGGRKLGLFDFLVGNPDRHGLNVVITKKGKVVGIDHGSPGIFSDSGYFTGTNEISAGGSAFSRRWIPQRTNKFGELKSVGKHDFTLAELDDALLSSILTDMPPEWKKQVRDRVELLKAKVSS